MKDEGEMGHHCSLRGGVIEVQAALHINPHTAGGQASPAQGASYIPSIAVHSPPEVLRARTRYPVVPMPPVRCEVERMGDEGEHLI